MFHRLSVSLSVRQSVRLSVCVSVCLSSFRALQRSSRCVAQNVPPHLRWSGSQVREGAKDSEVPYCTVTYSNPLNDYLDFPFSSFLAQSHLHTSSHTRLTHLLHFPPLHTHSTPLFHTLLTHHPLLLSSLYPRAQYPSEPVLFTAEPLILHWGEGMQMLRDAGVEVNTRK